MWLGHRGFSTDRSTAVPLLQFFFVWSSVISYVTLVLSLFVPYLSIFFVPHEGCASRLWHYLGIFALVFFVCARRYLLDWSGLYYVMILSEKNMLVNHVILTPK